jgi:hypothetical protein
METVLKLARESSQSAKLAYFCSAYVLAAILLIRKHFSPLNNTRSSAFTSSFRR